MVMISSTYTGLDGYNLLEGTFAEVRTPSLQDLPVLTVAWEIVGGNIVL